MKRVLYFLSNNYKAIIKALIVLIVAMCAYGLALYKATEVRGYLAVGGEIFVPLAIFFAAYAFEIFCETDEDAEE